MEPPTGCFGTASPFCSYRRPLDFDSALILPPDSAGRRVRRVRMPPKPAPCLFVVRAHLFHQSPECRRVIHPFGVHQLVIDHVVAHPVRHRDESPVESDGACRRTRAPAVALISNGDAADRHANLRGELTQARRQHISRLTSQSFLNVWRQIFRNRFSESADPALLAGDPALLLREKRRGFPLRPSPRDGHANASVKSHANQVTACARVPNEVHRCA